MFRQSIVKSVRPVGSRAGINCRLPLTSVRTMAEGATGSGASRPGGEHSGDAFSRREKANEDYYVRQKEKEKLLGLKEKLAAQRKHLDELDRHIDELTREQGGEHN
ncbi:hypothetical protein L228DRAFT_261322 [Xylona heveae TC161]|uniref:ATPase inhibitor, mitochondrial n=1 Tax=Xylona heveae (strain CBS 132557 / TC161) TaxID=1328760 RepID=A0A165GEV0_XYLHT|nr:hypothetical protein L228DRAFT_261322 [Xylona heveae TC161]KZF22102.1 hypothetical protein L228DRAFT_261322 [Xylona heveae TC161]